VKLALPRMLRSKLTRHPSARTRAWYAAGEPSAAMEDARADRARVAAHLVRCAECRADVAFQRGLRDALHRLPEPEPSDALLARVLSDRRKGNRLILPDVTTEARRPRRRVAAWLGAAAAVLLAAWLPLRQWWHGAAPRDAIQTTFSEPKRPNADGPAGAGDWFVSGGLFVDAAAAQTPRRGAPLSQAGPLAGMRLRPGRWTYAAQWTDSAGHTRFDGNATIAVDSAHVSPGGVPAWHVVQQWLGELGDHGERAEAETLLVRRDDLRPIERAVHVAPYNRNYRRLQVAQRFVGDSVLGEMRAEGTDGHRVRRPVARRLPNDGGPYLTDALAPLFLAAADLDRFWARRVSIVGWAVVPNDVAYRVELRVVGEDLVGTPAGTFDCWRLVVTARGRVIDYWVRKRDGVAVRSRDAVPRPDPGGGGPGVRQLVLVQE
jgi:hypothetical protein